MKKSLNYLFLLVQIIISLHSYAKDSDLREYFYAMINRPLNPTPYKHIENGDYLIDESELFWISVNSLVKATGNFNHSIGTHDPHNPLRADNVHFISDEDKNFIEEWFQSNEFYLTYDLIKDLEDLSALAFPYILDGRIACESKLYDTLCSRLVRRKESNTMPKDKDTTEIETIIYFEKNMYAIKTYFTGCNNRGRSLVYTVMLRGSMKFFYFVVSILTNGAIVYNPDCCVIDRPTMYAIEDWIWINEHKIPYSIIKEIVNAYYQYLSFPSSYEEFVNAMNDREEITAIKGKIAELHLTDIRSFLTSQP